MPQVKARRGYRGFARRSFLLLLMIHAVPTTAHAQGLRDLIFDLFVFGPGSTPLFLNGSAQDMTNAVHADHFVPAAVGASGFVTFLVSSLGGATADLPLTAGNSRRRFRFEQGAPVLGATSPGPIFAERAETLGRGNTLVGTTINRFSIRTLRGLDLDGVRFNIPHVNDDFPDCDLIFGADCSLFGVPADEADYVRVDLSLSVNVTAWTVVLSHGLLDGLDVSVAVPVLASSVAGFSSAQIVPSNAEFGTAHFFDGTLENPALAASRSVEGSALGIGDVAVRLKARVGGMGPVRFALVGDTRLPTGNEEDLLGAGSVSFRVLAVASAQFDALGPHLNLGFVRRGDADLNDAFLITAGFDQLLFPAVLFAIDLVSQLQLGASSYVPPEEVTIEAGSRIILPVSSIPDIRDDIVNLSIGFKGFSASRMRLITNWIVPVSRGGARPRLGWTFGLEYNF